MIRFRSAIRGCRCAGDRNGGSHDYCRPIAGSHDIKIISPHSLLRGVSIKSSRALVLNEGRGHAGLAAAKLLLRQGVEVEVITSEIAVAADLDPTNRNAWYTRLGHSNCRFTAGHVVDSASSYSLILRNVFDGRLQPRQGIDLIVDWPGCRANSELSGDSIDGTEFYKTGDCVAPRTVEIAMSEALMIANQI